MADPRPDSPLAWHCPDTTPFRLTGFPWYTEERIYRRLPTDPGGRYRQPVDELANCTAGGQVQFRTDTSRLAVRVELRGPHAMDHMPATGQCGVDCYIGEPGQSRYCSTSRFARDATTYESTLFEAFAREWRTITLNLPLYQGVHKLEIGLDNDAGLEPPPPFARPGKVVIYGTSITQGGCASRPGMAYTNLLARWLNLETVNLGFSGNGKGDPEVAEDISTIPEPLLFLLDYEANAGLDGLKQTLSPFIDILRAAHPTVPILVVSRPIPARVLHVTDRAGTIEAARVVQAETVARRRADGDANLHFLDGANLLGEDFEECTVDGAHPTDLGFYRMAKALCPVVRQLTLGE